MTIFRFALKRILRDKTNVLFLSLFPIAAIFLPLAQEGWPLLPLGYQYFGVLLLFVSIRLTSIMIEDRQKGVVKRLAAAPISHFNYLWQNLLAFSVIMVIQTVIVIIGGHVYGHELYEPWNLAILYIVFTFTSISISLAWNSLYRSKESSFLIFMAVIVLIALLGGILFPVEMMPEAFQRIAVIFPTYWLSEGIEWIVLGEDRGDFLFINGVLLLYALFFLIIGSIRRIS
ncbi:ABC transporter permease [Geomicrobium sp. JCM 19055]|uniref:ABC transporter permease n=1 Tax=Geomicrobium sp. JCM 19055 TaxID=1460649 RepID=UPI00045ED26D|nr:ABC transporter permease [Geomicrobium sp. JCM 19055]GAK00475.1 ABC-type multidrug transport system, permease component [Geomicrobium sp. JCM 19055]